MSKFDHMYLDTCKKIRECGVRTESRNGITYRIPGNHWIFDLEEEFPILTTKKVFWKKAVLEMLWIYQAKSIKVQWLRDRNIKIWDKFEIGPDGYYHNPDNGQVKFFGTEWAGTIGTSYAYIVANGGEPCCPDQVDAALYKIMKFPADRRIIISMWQPPFFGKAVLPPCVYKVQFLVLDGKLHSFVEQRSCDVFIGVPFNITQYAALTYLFAHACMLKPGTMHYNMVDTHIYEEHLDQIDEMIKREKDALPAPKLWINPDVKNFYDFDNSVDLKDFQLEDYKDLGALKGIVKA